MTEKAELTPEAICRHLKDTQLSLQIATIGEAGEPHIGYTPFTEQEGALVVFVSQLSLHTRDLLARPTAAVMLISDEQDASQIFARTRLSYQCEVERVAPSNSAYESLLDACEERHGRILRVLRELPDFVLFRLVPVSGMFVMGFGKAFHLSGPGLSVFEHARSA